MIIKGFELNLLIFTFKPHDGWELDLSECKIIGRFIIPISELKYLSEKYPLVNPEKKLDKLDKWLCYHWKIRFGTDERWSAWVEKRVKLANRAIARARCRQEKMYEKQKIFLDYKKYVVLPKPEKQDITKKIPENDDFPP